MPISRRNSTCASTALLGPYWTAPGAMLYLGDVRECLRALPARSVHMVVTSPPFWGLRDYQTGTWGGGSAECDHQPPPQDMVKAASSSGLNLNKDPNKIQSTLGGSHNRGYRHKCPKCGAKRTDMQIGMEPSPDCGTHGQAQCSACFVCAMVGVFREVKRVLRDDGTCWLNLGSTFISGTVESDRYVIRDDLTEREYQHVIKRIAETVSKVRETKTPAERDVPTVLREPNIQTGKLYNQTMSEVREDNQGSQTVCGEGTGEVLFEKLREVGESNKEENDTDSGMRGVRSGIREVPARIGLYAMKADIPNDILRCFKPSYKLVSGNDAGIPWRVALALQADGWVLRQDIIWHSPNKMPESVSNRCTKSHEHIFLLVKSDNYYYDAVAIQEPAKSSWKDSDFIPNSEKDAIGDKSAATSASRNNRSNVVRGKRRGGGSVFGKVRHASEAIAAGGQCREYDGGDPDFVNKRDVWIVPTTGYPGAHFAVYSPRLITPCILAGTSEHGCCSLCGSPWERVVVRTGAVKLEGESDAGERDRSYRWSRNGIDSTLDTGIAQRETVGWRKACGCQTDEVIPCTVLDPFVGSGTAVATALQLGRAGIGIDLSETYLRENAISRIEVALMGARVPRVATTAMPPSAPLAPRRLRR